MIKKLSRFTSLPILLDMLSGKKITLLDPVLWEDKNDTEVIMEYKKRKELKNLLALCFTHEDETVHHWKTFSGGNSGCVVEFDAHRMFAIFDRIDGLRHQPVVYRKISDVQREAGKMDVEEMPFTKRWPFRCEAEYRVIYEGDCSDTFYNIQIPLELINKITISQHMPKAVYETIKGYLRGLKGDPESRISHSTLYENRKWVNSFKKK